MTMPMPYARAKLDRIAYDHTGSHWAPRKKPSYGGAISGARGSLTCCVSSSPVDAQVLARYGVRLEPTPMRVYAPETAPETAPFVPEMAPAAPETAPEPSQAAPETALEPSQAAPETAPEPSPGGEAEAWAGMSLTPMLCYMDNVAMVRVRFLQERVFGSDTGVRRGTFIEDTFGKNHQMHSWLASAACAAKQPPMKDGCFLLDDGRTTPMMRHLDGKTYLDPEQRARAGLKAYPTDWTATLRQSALDAQKEQREAAEAAEAAKANPEKGFMCHH